MLGVVITLAVIAAVAWCIFKNYYPPTVLLIAGLLFLAVAACFGVDPVPAKASTHFLGFDFAQAFTDRMKTRLPGLVSTSCGLQVSRITWIRSGHPRLS